MIKLNVIPDGELGELIAGLEAVSTKYLPNTVRAIKVSISILEYTWKAYAMGAPIPGTSLRLKSVRGAYAKSIKKTTSGLGGTVYSDSPYAIAIEEGTDEKDLKKIIPFGPKSRMGKNGPYSIIPLRWGAPSSLNAPMPSVVYNQILQKIKAGEVKKSTVRKDTIIQKNAHGKEVERRQYNWGTRLKVPKFPNLEGMVVFNVSAGNQSRGEYLTFRVITANKPKVSKSQKPWGESWKIPAREGMKLTHHVVANTKDIIGETLQAGIVMDLTP